VPHLGKFHHLETRVNGAQRSWHRQSNRLVNIELFDLWKIVATEVTVSLKLEELATFLNRVNSENSPGLDSFFLEFILHAGSAPKFWFRGFYISCMRQLKIKKIWRRVLIVANPQPEKPLGSRRTNSNVPISLLSVPLNILERLIYAGVDPIIDPLLSREQVGFRHGWSAIDHVILQAQDNEDSVSVKKKAGAAFVDLTAAYDAVWHCGLPCNLPQLLCDRHMVCMIMEIVGNRSFTLTTRDGKEVGYDA